MILETSKYVKLDIMKIFKLGIEIKDVGLNTVTTF